MPRPRLPIALHLAPQEIARRYHACRSGLEETYRQVLWLLTRPEAPSPSRLATVIREVRGADDRDRFDTLSDLEIAARYDDTTWAERSATGENARLWIAETTDHLILKLRMIGCEGFVIAQASPAKTPGHRHPHRASLPAPGRLLRPCGLLAEEVRRTGVEV